MKLIRAGAKKKWWIGRKDRCRQCAAEVELEESDNVREYKTDSIAGRPYAYWVCPECGSNKERIYY